MDFPNPHTWMDVCVIAIVSAPGVIAAVSSLRNGKKLDRVNGAPKPAARKSSKQKDAGQQDWYKPPDL
jgi:hypothetical protein